MGSWLGQFKGSFLQSFMINAKPVLIPGQQFDLVAAFIDEDKHVTTQQGQVHLLLDQATKPVK